MDTEVSGVCSIARHLGDSGGLHIESVAHSLSGAAPEPVHCDTVAGSGPQQSSGSTGAIGCSSAQATLQCCWKECDSTAAAFSFGCIAAS